VTPKNASLALTASVLVAGCVSTAREVEYYDADCEIQSRKMVLDVQRLGNLNCTQSRECLATTLVIGAGSTIISGSIVLVGNTVYWLERVGKCAARPLNRIQSPFIGE
jgi:hypothetical protein